MKTFNYDNINAIKGLCGEIKESFHNDIGFARAEMLPGVSAAHYHKKTTEYYLILEGRGILRTQNIDGGTVNEAELKPGILVKIDKNEIHQTDNLESLVLEAITNPAWTKKDEIESKINLFDRNS